MLQGGETSVEGRIPYLQKGIVYQLAQATGGIGVILEHRYYGDSFPTPDLTTPNLRFLTTEQALADQAYFSRNIKFPGLEDKDLTSASVPHIAYGGSYAGAFVAFLRKLYPDDTWGAISSSGVTEAITDYWQYFEPIKDFGPPACISNHLKFINLIDNILLGDNDTTIASLKSAFGLQNLTYLDDFAQTVSEGIYGWQSKNWDPAVNSNSFNNYCNVITSNTTSSNATDSVKSTVSSLIVAGGWANESSTLLTPVLNLIGYVNTNFVSRCRGTQDSCFSNHPEYATYLDDKNNSNYDALSWQYQVCTQWGYYQNGAGYPKDVLPMISRLVDIPYFQFPCQHAFGLPGTPDTDVINQYGGFNLSYSRLAVIGGEQDVWRPASGLSQYVPDRLGEPSTTDQPLILIQGAVHHWDENGLFPNETTATLPPQPVKDAQSQEATFVKAWVDEFNQEKKLKRAPEPVPLRKQMRGPSRGSL